jgi:hypothetical protein
MSNIITSFGAWTSRRLRPSPGPWYVPRAVGLAAGVNGDGGYDGQGKGFGGCTLPHLIGHVFSLSCAATYDDEVHPPRLQLITNDVCFANRAE